MIGWGVLPGSWEAARDKARRINLIEPVVEGIIQLFFQSIILYIVIGPTADNGMVIVSLSHYLIRYIGNWSHEMILTFIP